ncbi:MAG: PD-(D/E)XK nuclease family protein, partial [Tumebacillaceae bacterium]
VQEEDAQVESDRSDVVKIMTIHKSKGLEFPVVILPDLGRQFNLQSGGAFRYDPELGLVLSFGEHDEWNDFGYARELRELNKAKAIEEERRKLYVAVTRARDYLVMVGTREDSSAKKKAMTRYDIRWFDWLVATIGGGDLVQMEGSILAEWPEVKWVTVQEEEAEQEKQPSADEQQRQAAFREVAAALSESAAGSEAGAGSQRHAAFPLLGAIQPREGEHPGILLSVSALMTYLTCPRQYFYKYEWKLPEQSHTAQLERADDELADERDSADDQFDLFAEPDPRATLDPTVRGTLVHRVLELLESPEEADRLIDRALAEQSIVGEEASRWHPYLKEDVNTYLQSSLFQNVLHAADKKSEMMFRLALGPHEITGIIDKVILGQNGFAAVIDYKTNRVFSAARIRQAVEHYSPQLQLYTLVTDRLLGWPVEQAVLYFTAPGRTEKVPIAASDLSALEQRSREACDHIATHDEPEDFAQLEQETDCERCGYRLLCRGY